MKRLSCICIAVVMLFVGVAIGFAVNKQSDATSVSKTAQGGCCLQGKDFSVSLLAHGKEVPTSYKIEKNTIVQKVDFAKKTAFSVKMSRKKHPPRMVYVGKINKAQAIRIRNKIKRAGNAKVLVLVICGKTVRIEASKQFRKKEHKYYYLYKKYSRAIKMAIGGRKHIKVYNIDYWKNSPRGGFYVTRDQELENVR